MLALPVSEIGQFFGTPLCFTLHPQFTILTPIVLLVSENIDLLKSTILQNISKTSLFYRVLNGNFTHIYFL